MRIRREIEVKREQRAGFTLVEVMVGVALIGMVVAATYAIVGAQLTGLQVSQAGQREGAFHDGLVRYLQGVFQGLSPKLTGSFVGIPHQFGMASADEIQWLARPGEALLTSAAPEDDYWLTLTIQPSTARSRVQDLGVRRRLRSEAEGAYEWIPLISDVAALEFRYWEPALQLWVERWENPNALPALVRMKLWRRADERPFEVVFWVPSSKVQN